MLERATSPRIDLAAGLDLLFSMKRIRAVEEAIAARYPEGKMRCPTHLSIGQEGPAAAVGQALRREDLAVSSHRAHAHYLAKGGDLKAFISEIYGKATGCARGKGGSMHLVDLAAGFCGSTAIVGNSIPVGVGLALSQQCKRNGFITCVFFGDGAVEEGAFHESVNFAVLRKLPVLFVCENNLYSVYTPLAQRQPRQRPIWKLAAAHGLRAVHADGNDALASHEVARALVADVRAGAGPAFVEYETYRWREHCGPNYDNDIGYRTQAEYESWKAKEPIACLERVLGVSSDAVAEMDARIRVEIDEAFAFAEAAPFPDAAELYTDVFAEGPWAG